MLINDPEVERLLDDLDIAMADRSELFDVLDADGDGRLEVQEVTRGLLKLRGSAEKSDMVACLLAVRNLQGMFVQFQDELQDLRHMTMTDKTLTDKTEKVTGSSLPGFQTSRESPLQVLKVDHHGGQTVWWQGSEGKEDNKKEAAEQEE
eukprot:CAMPEP_0115388612 /NCGR_PEP_ID=MMETSP0271-20121206/9266_1 /TAXON_ID=71861 /ORGANISM="Scrippsiella trochoidea, Strain CCMP3099" /LENGTH=148 /DNA_ID=CAMNT_0002812109 /DNA_START=32 /DNA_END=477 /DNA_ORIENTATION=-